MLKLILSALLLVSYGDINIDFYSKDKSIQNCIWNTDEGGDPFDGFWRRAKIFNKCKTYNSNGLTGMIGSEENVQLEISRFESSENTNLNFRIYHFTLGDKLGKITTRYLSDNGYSSTRRTGLSELDIYIVFNNSSSIMYKGNPSFIDIEGVNESQHLLYLGDKFSVLENRKKTGEITKNQLVNLFKANNSVQVQFIYNGEKANDSFSLSGSSRAINYVLSL
jgi:hypothetical protein